MPNYYQPPFNVRTAAILTNSYVAGTVLDMVHFNNQVTLHVSFTKGSLTSAEIKIEFSQDGTNYTQETNLSITGGTTTWTLAENTMTATGNYTYSMPIKSKYVKISAKGTGTVTSSSLSITAETGNV